MTLTPEIEADINAVVSKIGFPPDPTSYLTQEQRAQKAEKAIRKLVLGLFRSRQVWVCPHCKTREYLHKAHSNPTHRHNGTLFLLRQTD